MLKCSPSLWEIFVLTLRSSLFDVIVAGLMETTGSGRAGPRLNSRIGTRKWSIPKGTMHASPRCISVSSSGNWMCGHSHLPPSLSSRRRLQQYRCRVPSVDMLYYVCYFLTWRLILTLPLSIAIYPSPAPRKVKTTKDYQLAPLVTSMRPLVIVLRACR